MLKRKGGIGRERREPLNYNSIHNATLTERMNTLRAHGTTTHVLTKYTAGQCQPQGSHDHMTVADATETHQTLNKR